VPLVQVNWKPGRRQLRTFGLVGSAAFCALAAVAAWQGQAGGPLAAHAAAVWSAICVWTLAAILAPRLLLPFYLVVTAVSLPIGIAVSFVILAVMYFCIFTPIALAFRLVGRDSLHRRFEPEADTYWIPRRPNDDVRRYFRQF